MKNQLSFIFGYMSPNNKSVFDIFAIMFTNCNPKLVHVELCSTLSPYANIHGLHGDYLLSGPEDLWDIRTHVKGGTFAILRTLSLIYPCEEVTLQTERACQVWYASKQLVIYQCHDDSTYNSMLKYVKYRYLLWLPKCFKTNKNSNSLTYKIRHVMIPQSI